MDFALAAEEKALAEALSQTLGRVCSTARLRAWEAEQVSFDAAFHQALAQGGFLEAGLAFGDCPSFPVLAQLEEVAGGFLAPALLSWIPGYAAFLVGDTPLARRLAAGEIVAPAIPGRSRLVLEGGRLSGTAEGVPFLDRAAHVLALTGDCAVLVPAPPLPVGGEPSAARQAQGLTAEFVVTQSLVPRWRVTFTAAEPSEIVPVPADRSEPALNRLRVCLAAWAAGAGRQAIDLASAYAREREQFGHPIGSYQSVQNRLVDAAIQVEEAHMLVHRAAALVEAGAAEAADMARLARRQAGKAFTLASRAALLTFGGYGFTMDFDIQLYFRRAKEAELAFEPRPPAALAPGFRS